MPRLLEQFMDQEKIYSLEGNRGVEGLCKIAHALGYQDPMRFGQLAPNVAVGDLLEFLRDNSGACEAIVAWIQEHEHFWADILADQVECDEDDDIDEEDEE
jgi:hypothetical protein